MAARKPAPPSAEPPSAEPRFEDALEQLEQLVAALEGGEQSLEDSLLTFEQGVRLVRFCAERLRSAELRVRELEEGPEGTRERPLEVEVEDES